MLVGIPRYKTYWQLWMQKAGRLPEEDLSDNDRIVIGQHVEEAIAHAWAEMNGHKIRKTRRYLKHRDCRRMGASLDFELLTPDAGWVPLEIKNVDYFVFRDEWGDADGRIEPPGHIALQLQHQLEVVDKPYGYLVALVSGNDLRTQRIDRNAVVGQELLAGVQKFWQEIEDDIEPDPDYIADYKAMARVYAEIETEAEADEHEDVELAAILYDAARAKKTAENYQEQYDRIRGALFQRYKGLKKIRGAGASISFRSVPAQPARQVQFKASEARREMRITFNKELLASV